MSDNTSESTPRTVEVPQEQRRYRCRIEYGVSLMRRRPSWRVVVEALWTAIPDGMVEPNHWRPWERLRWRTDEVVARRDAEAWLDAAEARAATEDDYV